MNKNTKVLLFVFSFLFAGFLFSVGDASALDYQLLEKIPGTSGVSGSDLPGYISAIYRVALIVVTLSAVLMLSIGGFMYLTSAGNTSSISTAKGIIYDSLIGLVIALSAWLILYTINPDLVEITLTPLPPAQIVNIPRPVLGDPDTAPTGSDAEVATYILSPAPFVILDTVGDCKDANGVTVSPQKNIASIAGGERATHCNNKCGAPERIACTGTTKLSRTMLDAIAKVGSATGPGISFRINSIAGGPHASNSKHYSGQAIDISTPVNNANAQTLMNAFVAAGAVAPNGTAGSSMCEKPIRDTSGKILRVESVDCTTGGANHLHIVFPN